MLLNRDFYLFYYLLSISNYYLPIFLYGENKTAMVTVTHGADARERKKASKLSQPSELNVIRKTTRVVYSDQNYEKHLSFSRLPLLCFTELDTLFTRISPVMLQR